MLAVSCRFSLQPVLGVLAKSGALSWEKLCLVKNIRITDPWDWKVFPACRGFSSVLGFISNTTVMGPPANSEPCGGS